MNRERRYFGTDGIRGVVGLTPITPEFVLKLGWAAGRVLARDGRGMVLIGKDTRISGYMFEAVLEAGLSAAGIDIRLLGPMPTPAVAYLTRTFNASAGIVISASHNPYEDNGIKFFDGNGAKLPDEVELAIEAELDHPMETVSGARLGKAQRIGDAAGRYVEFCKSTVRNSSSVRGAKIVLDCAHGATYQVAPSVFAELGATVIPTGVTPNGLNINDGCGAVSPQALCEAVVAHGADLGIAFDGDGDRVVFVDNLGQVLDGDELLYIIASARVSDPSFHGPVVGTVMSNFGLQEALGTLGLELERTKVGDRYVLEAMKTRNALLGGETSGHIICLERVTTGDGLVAALQVLDAVERQGRSVSELRGGMRKYPQVLVNVTMPEKVPAGSRGKAVLDLPPVGAAVRAAEAELGSCGRVLIRPSGTEPVVRVMVEGLDPSLVQNLAERLAESVTHALGEVT